MSSTSPKFREPLDTLTDINLDDLLDAAALPWLRRTPLRRLFHPPPWTSLHRATSTTLMGLEVAS